MSLWQTLARVKTAAGDDIHLRQRGGLFEIRYNGIELMSNINHHSEDQLALRLMRRPDFSPRRILIAGLGLGFTLRAVLDLARSDAEITLCELIPEVVEWNRGPLAHLAAAPLEDPRVRVVVGDIREHLASHCEQYDLMLFDTDNGPEILVRAENDAIYGREGMEDVLRVLAAGGRAAFWSATVSSGFEAALTAFGWQWRREDIALLPGRADAMHHIYVCQPGSALLAQQAA